MRLENLPNLVVRMSSALFNIDKASAMDDELLSFTKSFPEIEVENLHVGYRIRSAILNASI